MDSVLLNEIYESSFYRSVHWSSTSLAAPHTSSSEYHTQTHTATSICTNTESLKSFFIFYKGRQILKSAVAWDKEYVGLLEGRHQSGMTKLPPLFFFLQCSSLLVCWQFGKWGLQRKLRFFSRKNGVTRQDKKMWTLIFLGSSNDCLV